MRSWTLTSAFCAFLKKNKALDMNPDALVNWLWEHLALPPGWKVAKLRSKTGKPKRNPALVIDGEGLRITRFFEYKKAKKMSKTKRVEDVKHEK